MEQLTQREKNRINSALKQSNLNLFDTKDKMSSEEIVTKVSNKMNRCTNRIKSVLDVFLCGTAIDQYCKSLFSSIDSNGISDIAKICSKLEEDKDALGKITIKTFFGTRKIIAEVLPKIKYFTPKPTVQYIANINFHHILHLMKENFIYEMC